MAEVSAKYDQNTLYANLKELILKDGKRLFLHWSKWTNVWYNVVHYGRSNFAFAQSSLFMQLCEGLSCYILRRW